METVAHPCFTRKKPWKSRLSRRLMFDAAPPSGRVCLLLAPDGAAAFRAVLLPVAAGSNRQKYCPECGSSIRRKQKADSARRRRSVEH